MKITYIVQHFRTPGMPGSTRSYEFARRLVARGHEVHVVTGDPGAHRAGGSVRVAQESGIVVHWLPVPYHNSMSYHRRIRSFATFVRRGALEAAKLRHDLVFASSTPLTVAIPGMYAAARRGVPMVMEIRDLWPEVPIALGALRSAAARWLAWRLEAWAYRRSAQIIALSPGMADSIRRRFPETRVTVVPNGADRALFADADRLGHRLRRTTPWLGDRPLVLYAGTMGLVNGVEYLVRAASVLADQDPEIRIALVGEGRMAHQVRRLATELGVLNKNLFILPSVPKEAVVAFFGACDLAVSTTIDVPALNANSANKVFDALAAGRPVGVNHGGWLADMIADHGAGLVLPAGDPHGAAVAMSALLRDEAACETARTAARRLARDCFDRDLLFEAFERALLDATGAQRGAGVETGRGLARVAGWR